MIIGLSDTFVTWCTSQIDTSIVAAAWPLQAYFLLGEIPNATHVMGYLTICLAVGMVAWGNKLKEELDHIQ